ncbi:MAG: hypothetical protein PHC61_11910 [Chitinivibrionales bacterium]|nr:hypothetical protein [Chitinivibrionales bacterium]
MKKPEFKLKERLRLAGIAHKDVAELLHISEDDLKNRLDGFAALTDRARGRIYNFIGQHEQQKRLAAGIDRRAA